MWPMLIAAGGSLLGNFMQQQGGRETNAQNAQEAERNREFQAQQSSAQMGFQAQMSNTSHQREVADLKAAGLNPLLSANAGASTPSGASASGAQAQMQNPNAGMGDMITSALGAMTAVQGLEKQAAETEYIKTQSHVAKKGIPESDIKNEVFGMGKSIIKKAKQWFQKTGKDASKSSFFGNQHQNMIKLPNKH